MGKETSHTPPSKIGYTIQQLAMSGLWLATIIAMILFVVVAIMLSAPLFFLMSVILLLLSMPPVMTIVNTPPLIIRDEGLILRRFIGGERTIGWDEIDCIKAYPLLPQADQEILKQYLIGRNKYRPAEGIMLIIPTLPLPYRIGGVLTAEKGNPVIAFTNRTHSDYDTLKHRIMRYAPHAVHESLIDGD